MSKNDTIVRRFEVSDVNEIIRLAMIEVPKLPNYKGINVDPDRLRFMLTQNVRAEDAYFVSVLSPKGRSEVVGLMAAWCVTSLISWDKFTGDIYLTVKREWRTLQNAKKLLEAYKEWGIRRGAKIISATVTSGYDDAAMDALLTKHLKFDRIGTLYHFRPK